MVHIAHLHPPHDPASCQNPFETRNGPQREPPLMHRVALGSQFVEASQMQPKHWWLAPSIPGGSWLRQVLAAIENGRISSP